MGNAEQTIHAAGLPNIGDTHGGKSRGRHFHQRRRWLGNKGQEAFERNATWALPLKLGGIPSNGPSERESCCLYAEN